MKKQIKIMRGVSGAGKSTYANRLSTNVVSADSFFVKDGKYCFDGSRIGMAHRVCLRNFIELVQNGTDLIVVDNTNIRLEDVAPYVAIGEAYDYDVEIIQVDTDPQVAAPRNLHSVPVEKVNEMHRSLWKTHLPKRWKVTHVVP